MFSARLTVILFILISFEIGALLLFLPWHRSWQENDVLSLLTERTGWTGLATAILSPYVRGLVSGLGIVNFCIGMWELAHFRETVRAFGGGDDAAVSDS